MRQDILKTIAAEKDVTNVVVLTHNIDFVFLQGVVVPKLKKCGHPTLTVFADAACCEKSFLHQGDWVDGIGRRYRVVPVAMEPGFCFHPKAVLLSSETKAKLLIGSGNLGFGGWRENGECWISFDTDEDGATPFAAFEKYLKSVLKRVPINASIDAEIREAFDPGTRAWAAEMTEGEFVLGKCGNGSSLIEQLQDAVGQGPFEQLTVCTPYFDEKAEMLVELSERFKTTKTRVLIQNGKSTLLKSAADALPSGISIQPVDFQREENRSSFLHAKFYAFEDANKVQIISGSANCSLAALQIPGKGGNAELVTVRSLTPSEFKEAYLEELSLPDEPVALKDEIEKTRSETFEANIHILGAHFEHGQIRIGFKVNGDVGISACIVDGETVDYEKANEQELLVHSPKAPSRVFLEGKTRTDTIRSATCWIDNEFFLRSNSKRRLLVDTLGTKIRGVQWNIGAYADVLKIFHQHLEYMDQKTGISRTLLKRKDKQDKSIVYSESDIFSDDFGLPSSLSIRMPSGEKERIDGFRKMILRWFGVETNGETTEEVDLDESESESDDEPVDRVERLPSPKKKVTTVKAEGSELRRAKKTVENVISTMASTDFLRKRSPKQLGIDIAVIVVLLRSGLSENWLTTEDFFVFTHKLWSVLFFSSHTDEETGKEFTGFLQFLYENSDDPDLYADSMASSDVSVTLAAWTLALPEVSKEMVLFELGTVTSVARFRWLWKVEEKDKVATRLQENLVHTGVLRADDFEMWNIYRMRWGRLIQTGYAIGNLERLLAGYSPVDLKDQITWDCVSKGELLWQGQTGLCIAAEDCRRSQKGSVQVYCLHRSNPCVKFGASFLIPLEALLKNDRILQKESLGTVEIGVIRDYMRRVQSTFEMIYAKSEGEKSFFKNV